MAKFSRTFDKLSEFYTTSDGNKLQILGKNFKGGFRVIDSFRFLDEKNQLHNSSGVANVNFFENTNLIRSMSYYIHGKLHRLGGPAYIEFYENGDVKNMTYKIDGNQVPREQALSMT